jgi:hypothetical protein
LKVIEGRQKEGQKVGDVIPSSQTEWYQPALDSPLRFKGNVYVLIGARTYSSSVLFTNAVQDMGFAVIAGTGGAARTTQSGGTQNGKLPNTGLGFVIPRFVLKRSSGTEGFMHPDIFVADDPFRPRAAIEALLRL